MKKFELIGLSYSPWTEKAKWALDHHRVPYHYSEHLMIFGMPTLWIKTGHYFKGLTVPLMIAGDRKLLDSFEIAKFAEENGTSETLFANAEEVQKWNDLSEKGLDAGRGLLLYKLARNPKAMVENLPPPFPQTRALNWLVRVATAYVSSGFKASAKTQQDHLNTLREVLSKLRANLRGNYLLGKFSYADICMAPVLQFVKPVDDRYIKLGPETRHCWGNPELVDEFKDLLDWRDKLYQKHRSVRFREPLRDARVE